MARLSVQPLGRRFVRTSTAKYTFPKFVDELAAVWGRQWSIMRLETAHGPAMPKASTFYAGSKNSLGKHIFLKLQHNPKSWKAGSFTVDVIVSERHGMPAVWRLPKHDDFERGVAGSYRLGSLLHGKDKWWCLRPIEWEFSLSWRPSSYEDPALVRREAIADVTNDVEQLLQRIVWRGVA